MQVQGGNHMKNTFVLNGLSITIEGQPIAIDKLEVTSEMSAQELATSGGLISGLIKEIKPLIAEAATTTAPTPTNHNYSNNYKNNNYSNNYKNNNYSNNYKKDNYGSHQRAFDALPKPTELREDGYKSWAYEVGSYAEGNRLKIKVDNTKWDVIHINIMSTTQQAHVHIYPDTTTWHGASLETLPEIIKHMGVPETIQAYLLKVVAL
jgi:hypothetical protein